MTNTNQYAKSIGVTAIKTEIARRNPVNDQAVEDAIAHRLRIDELGVPYVVDRSGAREDNNTLEQFLDEVVRDRPDLWQSRPSSPSGTKPSVTNPFMKGTPHYNISEGMKLYLTDPDKARELAFMAGMNLN